MISAWFEVLFELPPLADTSATDAYQPAANLFRLKLIKNHDTLNKKKP